MSSTLLAYAEGYSCVMEDYCGEAEPCPRMNAKSGVIGTRGKDGQGVPVSSAQPTLRIPELIVGGQQSS